jgi:hypothetical protein
MFKTLYQEKGFSLLEVLVGGAITLGVVGSAAYLFSSQRTTQKKIDHDQDLSAYHRQLSTILTKPNNCNAIFRESAGRANLVPFTELFICGDEEKCQRLLDAETVKPFAQSYLKIDDYINDRKIWFVESISVLPPDPKTGVTTMRIGYKINPEIIHFPQKTSKEILVLPTFLWV